MAIEILFPCLDEPKEEPTAVAPVTTSDAAPKPFALSNAAFEAKQEAAPAPAVERRLSPAIEKALAEVEAREEQQRLRKISRSSRGSGAASGTPSPLASRDQSRNGTDVEATTFERRVFTRVRSPSPEPETLDGAEGTDQDPEPTTKSPSPVPEQICESLQAPIASPSRARASSTLSHLSKASSTQSATTSNGFKARPAPTVVLETGNPTPHDQSRDAPSRDRTSTRDASSFYCPQRSLPGRRRRRSYATSEPSDSAQSWPTRHHSAPDQGCRPASRTTGPERGDESDDDAARAAEHLDRRASRLGPRAASVGSGHGDLDDDDEARRQGGGSPHESRRLASSRSRRERASSFFGKSRKGGRHGRPRESEPVHVGSEHCRGVRSAEYYGSWSRSRLGGLESAPRTGDRA